jgi:hypothetical protein
MSKNKELVSKNLERSEVVKDADGFYPHQYRSEEDFIKDCGMTKEEFDNYMNPLIKFGEYLIEESKTRMEKIQNGELKLPITKKEDLLL